MMSSVLFFKHKLRFITLVILATYGVFAGTKVQATDLPMLQQRISEEGRVPSPQNELLLSIHQLDAHSYVVHLTKLQTRTKPNDEKSLKTSRKAVKEALLEKNIKHLSRYKAEQE
ncbi:MAG: hypothetical protein H0X26_06815 [Alphaproteobacteria bacterium]|nr:hypothetical protein [Alphaproteobacteria bacterium]